MAQNAVRVQFPKSFQCIDGKRRYLTDQHKRNPHSEKRHELMEKRDKIYNHCNLRNVDVRDDKREKM